MFCKKCGAELDADASFCHKCGIRIFDEKKVHTNYTVNEFTLDGWFKGRIGRIHWLLGMLFIIFVNILFAIAIPMGQATAILVLFPFVIATVGSFSIHIRRLHDMNQSGWYSLFSVVPVANLFFLIIMAIKPGDNHENNYGKRMPANADLFNVLLGKIKM